MTVQSWITQAAARAPPGPQHPRACDLCVPHSPTLHSLTCTAPNIYINIYRSLLLLLPRGVGGLWGGKRDRGGFSPSSVCEITPRGAKGVAPPVQTRGEWRGLRG